MYTQLGLNTEATSQDIRKSSVNLNKSKFVKGHINLFYDKVRKAVGFF